MISFCGRVELLSEGGVSRTLRVVRSIFASTATVVAAAFVSSSIQAAESAEKPNVIIIMVDDMGYGGASCFDNQHFDTPEIDRLAADGVLLSDFHSNGSQCSPTRGAFVTGRCQQRSGCDQGINADPAVAMHHVGIHEKEWIFAEAMQEEPRAVGMFDGCLIESRERLFQWALAASSFKSLS